MIVHPINENYPMIYSPSSHPTGVYCFLISEEYNWSDIYIYIYIYVLALSNFYDGREWVLVFNSPLEVQ